MSVKIRLRRTGSRNAGSFRVVASEKSSPRDGRFIETLGWYDPKRVGRNFQIDLERVEHWVSNGAEVSETVKSLVKQARRAPAEEAPAEAAPAEAAPEPAAAAEAPTEAEASDEAPVAEEASAEDSEEAKSDA